MVIKIKQVTEENYTASQSDWEAMCKEIAHKYWGLTFDIPVYLNEGLRCYGRCNYKYIRNKERKVIGKEPTCIEVSREACENFDYQRMLDLLKHEVCHWACVVQGKPTGDGTKHFESELRRIGSTTTGIDMHLKNYRELSQKLSNERLQKFEKKSIDGLFSDIHIYLIRRKGYDFYRLTDGKWNKQDASGAWEDCQKYDYYYFFTFMCNGQSHTGGIGYVNEKWHFRHQLGLYKTDNSNQKLHLDRKSTMQLRKMAIEHAQTVNELLGINSKDQ